MHGNKKKETYTETGTGTKNVFTMTSGGFVIVVRNISFIDSVEQ